MQHLVCHKPFAKRFILALVKQQQQQRQIAKWSFLQISSPYDSCPCIERKKAQPFTLCQKLMSFARHSDTFIGLQQCNEGLLNIRLVNEKS